jgi:hypothetical protein
VLAVPTALGMACFLVWLLFFKRWQVEQNVRLPRTPY